MDTPRWFNASTVFMAAIVMALVALLFWIAFMRPAHAKGLYVNAGIGANWADVIDAPQVKDNTGVALAVSLGMPVEAVPGLAFEIEAAYRQNDVDVVLGPFTINANQESTALMGNAVYTFAQSWPVHPRVKLGAGYASHQGTFENVSLLRVENGGFAWQAGAGVEWPVAKGLSVAVDYVYFAGPELAVLNYEIADGTSQSVIASVKLSLD